VATTGTNGKTSTAWWTAQALTALGRRCGVIGTLGIGEPPRRPRTPGRAATGLTTPDPVALQAALADFVTQGFAACAFEASSIGIAEHRLAGTQHRGGAVHQLHARPPRLPRQHGRLLGRQARAVRLARAARRGDQRRRRLRRALAAELAASGLPLWTVSVRGPARLRAERPALRRTVAWPSTRWKAASPCRCAARWSATTTPATCWW
jgi:hypothetical protein